MIRGFLGKLDKIELPILLIILIFNFTSFFSLYIGVEAFRLMADITTSIEIAGFWSSKTMAPEFDQLLYHIFEFNYPVFLIYLLFILLSYLLLVIRKLRNQARVLFVIAMNMILTCMILIFFPSIYLLLLLLYNSTILIQETLKRVLNHQTIMVPIVCLLAVSILSISFDQLIKFYSIEGSDSIGFNERFLYDLNYLQGVSRFILLESFLRVYYYLFLIVVFYLLYQLYRVIVHKPHWQMNKKKFTQIIYGLFFLHFILPMFILIAYKSILLKDREVESLSGCYKSYMELGLGKTYLKEDNLYFDRCFDTENGIYTVYWEVEEEEHHLFDVIHEVIFKEIIVLNAQGEKVMSFESDRKDITIYVTTKEDTLEGYNRLIFVEKLEEGGRFADFTFYHLDGELMFELPYGIPERSYVKRDPLNPSSMIILFKGDQLIYNEVSDDQKLIGKYIYYVDGRKELLDE